MGSLGTSLFLEDIIPKLILTQWSKQQYFRHKESIKYIIRPRISSFSGSRCRKSLGLNHKKNKRTICVLSIFLLIFSVHASFFLPFPVVMLMHIQFFNFFLKPTKMLALSQQPMSINIYRYLILLYIILLWPLIRF